MMQRSPNEMKAVYKAAGNKALDRVQDGLSVAGAVPVFGEPADAANAGISAARGDYLDALINGGAAVSGPFGNILSIGNRGRKLAKVADAAGEVTEGGRAATKGTEGIYEFADAANEGRTYVGQSGNIPARVKQHERAGRLAPGGEAKTRTVTGGKTKRELAEQRRIDQLGGTRNNPGSRTSNARNPVSRQRRRKLQSNDEN